MTRRRRRTLTTRSSQAAKLLSLEAEHQRIRKPTGKSEGDLRVCARPCAASKYAPSLAHPAADGARIEIGNGLNWNLTPE